MYKKIVKPVLFLLSPDFVHRAMIGTGRVVQSIWPLRWLLQKMWRRDDDRLAQDILGIHIKNPIGLSAGLDKNIEIMPLIKAVGFGFETGGSVTLAPRIGNPRPWFHRLPRAKSLLVHAGMPNKGMPAIAKSIKKSCRRAKDFPLFISVAVVAKSPKETNRDAIIDAKNTIKYVLEHTDAIAVEINISCPNVGDGQPFSEPRTLELLLTEVDTLERTIPFFVKMPNLRSLTRFDALLRVINKHNIQGLTIANLVKDWQPQQLPDTVPADARGGLSGLVAQKRSTALIRYTYNTYGKRFVIIGVGGVFSAKDAYEKIRAGASLVDIITGVIYEGPAVVGAINKELAAMLEQDGFACVADAVGVDAKKSEKK